MRLVDLVKAGPASGASAAPAAPAAPDLLEVRQEQNDDSHSAAVVDVLDDSGYEPDPVMTLRFDFE